MNCVLCILWCILWASGPEINVILSILSYLITYTNKCGRLCSICDPFTAGIDLVEDKRR